MAGLGAERAAGHDCRLAVADRVLIELPLQEVPMNCAQLCETELVGSASSVPQPRLAHCVLLSKSTANNINAC